MTQEAENNNSIASKSNNDAPQPINNEGAKQSYTPRPRTQGGQKPGDSRFRKFDNSRGRGGMRTGSRNMVPREKNPLFSKVLCVDRVGKTNTGGKVISFAAFSVVGDENGSVGVGLGKAKEVAAAVEKSKNMAKKNMYKLPLDNLDTIPHNVEKEFCGTKVCLMKGKKGFIASNLAKNIFKAAGIKNMAAKALGARSVKNTAYAIIEALKMVESPAMIAKRRSMDVREVLNRQKTIIYYGLMRKNAMKNRSSKEEITK